MALTTRLNGSAALERSRAQVAQKNPELAKLLRRYVEKDRELGWSSLSKQDLRSDVERFMFAGVPVERFEQVATQTRTAMSVLGEGGAQALSVTEDQWRAAQSLPDALHESVVSPRTSWRSPKWSSSAQALIEPHVVRDRDSGWHHFDAKAAATAVDTLKPFVTATLLKKVAKKVSAEVVDAKKAAAIAVRQQVASGHAPGNLEAELARLTSKRLGLFTFAFAERFVEEANRVAESWSATLPAVVTKVAKREVDAAIQAFLKT